jgi:hypothetical protein
MPCKVVAAMQLGRIRRHESEKNNEIDANNKSCSENRSKANSSRSICRLDRKRQQKCWRRCYWKSFMACIIIVLLHLTSIECLQARQEGEFKTLLNCFSRSLHIKTMNFFLSIAEKKNIFNISFF